MARRKQINRKTGQCVVRSKSLRFKWDVQSFKFLSELVNVNVIKYFNYILCVFCYQEKYRRLFYQFCTGYQEWITQQAIWLNLRDVSKPIDFFCKSTTFLSHYRYQSDQCRYGYATLTISSVKVIVAVDRVWTYDLSFHRSPCYALRYCVQHIYFAPPRTQLRILVIDN